MITTTSYTTLDCALSYARIGMSVFPIAIGSKGGNTTRWKKRQTEAFSQEDIESLPWEDRNLAIALGYGGWLVIDIDHATSDTVLYRVLDCLDLSHSYQWVVRSGSGKGFHVYIKVSGNTKVHGKARVTLFPTDATLCKQIEVRGLGSYVAAPPSLHAATGKLYTWANERVPEQTALAVFENTEAQNVVNWLAPIATRGKNATRRKVETTSESKRQGKGRQDISVVPLTRDEVPEACSLDALLERIDEAEITVEAATVSAFLEGDFENEAAVIGYIRKAFKREIKSIAHTLEGNRNETLNRRLYKLAVRYLTALPRQAFIDAAFTAARYAGLEEAEIFRTVNSALRDGARDFEGIRIPECVRQKKKRRYMKATWKHDWQDATPEEHQAMLERASKRIYEKAEAILREGKPGLYVIVAPPGLGKSNMVAPLAVHPFDVAYMVQRHDMIESVPALQQIRQMQPPGPDNTKRYQVIRAANERGYSARGQAEPNSAYRMQWKGEGSAVYVHQLAKTSAPWKHRDGVIVDEFSLSTWCSEIVVNPTKAKQGLIAIQGVYSKELKALLRPVLAAVEKVYKQIDKEIARNGHEDDYSLGGLRGKHFFDAVDSALKGQLWTYLMKLERQRAHLEPMPPLEGRVTEKMLDELPNPRAGVLVLAMLDEWRRWQEGTDFNSRLFLDKDGISITEQSYLPYHEKPIIILDATANTDVLTNLFWDAKETKIEIISIDADPAPNTRHIHVTTKRYGKLALTQAMSAEQERQMAIATVKHVAMQEGVNLDHCSIITHMGCKQALIEGLEAQDSLHFHALSGSNTLNESRTLVVMGTPGPNPKEVMRLAHAIYWNDPKPIMDQQDERFQKLMTYLIESELTQAVHRSRPIRFDERTILTLSSFSPDYLPATTHVTGLPMLEADGSNKQDSRDSTVKGRILAAILEVERAGLSVTVRNVQSKAKARMKMVAEVVAEYKAP